MACWWAVLACRNFSSAFFFLSVFLPVKYTISQRCYRSSWFSKWSSHSSAVYI
jgi:hypothetical protein